MDHKKKLHQRVGGFLAGRGFYIVLLLCVATIGASGYYLYRVSTDVSLDGLQSVSAPAQVTVPAPEIETGADAAASDDVPGAGTTQSELAPAAPEEETAPAPEEPAIAEAAPAEETAAPAEDVPAAGSVSSMVWPITGEVVAAFSSDTLTYNEAMADWRTHGGIDISCDLGAEVAAAAGGTVAAITQDALLGATVTVNHTGGLSTVYGNLDPDTVSLATGDAVDAGMILGCVGTSATGERRTGAWLHFEVLQDGTPIDPGTYLQ